MRKICENTNKEREKKREERERERFSDDWRERGKERV